MSKQSIFVGLDVHADTVAVAVVQGRDVVRSLGIVPNTPEALRRSCARWARGRICGCAARPGRPVT